MRTEQSGMRMDPSQLARAKAYRQGGVLMKDAEEMAKAAIKWRCFYNADIEKLLNDQEDGFKSLEELTAAALAIGIGYLNNEYESHKYHKQLEEEGQLDGDD